ncbi:hypothetical protein [Sphingomonas arenae]|uniref:hypothetical protein n=1 Tax=Sphingomonas arenae TaxID=2812555 RepID=UPI00196731FA|nr:hypothetical protein [Sphingomonas arenae]
MIAVAALLLAAQPQAAKPSTEWLTGLWVEQADPKRRSLDGCASWSALFYRADSTFSHGDREGYWVLRDNRVYELDRSPDRVPVDELLSASEDSAQVVRLAADRMRKVLPGGKSVTFLRCPKPETPVAL